MTAAAIAMAPAGGLYRYQFRGPPWIDPAAGDVSADQR